MSRKLDPQTVSRICELYFDYELSVPVIAERLGVSPRAIFNYLKRGRDERMREERGVLSRDRTKETD